MERETDIQGMKHEDNCQREDEKQFLRIIVATHFISMLLQSFCWFRFCVEQIEINWSLCGRYFGDIVPSLSIKWKTGAWDKW